MAKQNNNTTKYMRKWEEGKKSIKSQSSSDERTFANIPSITINNKIKQKYKPVWNQLWMPN